MREIGGHVRCPGCESMRRQSHFFQVKRIVRGNSLQAKDVAVPRIFVDEVVVCENPAENHRMTSSVYYDPHILGKKSNSLKALSAK